MWLNRLFCDTPVDFAKRCRNRMAASAVIIAAGALALTASWLFRENYFHVVSGEAASENFIPGFYTGTGFGLIASGIITCIQNYRYLKNNSLYKRRSVEETDERNRLLGLRCWAYAGYTLFLILYLGMLISGFINVIILKVLLAVAAVFALLLLIFRIVLERCM